MSRSEPFLWGVATSAYQSEGGYNGTGQPVTNWADAERRGDVMRCGNAADFLSRYNEDFARSRELDLNAFRLGVEWTRIQPRPPNPGDDGFDIQALDLYADMLAAARRNGLEPILTLHHFVHPAWLGPDPWLATETASLFRSYVARTVRTLNRQLVDRHSSPPIRYYLTINEPNMLVFNTYFAHQFPGGPKRGIGASSDAFANLIRSHVLAYNEIHDIYEQAGWPSPKVSLNNYCNDLYWSDKLILDLLAIRERKIHPSDVGDYIGAQAAAFDREFVAARIPLHRDLPYFFGAAVKRMSNWRGYRRFRPDRYPLALETIQQASRECTFDYLALENYEWGSFTPSFGLFFLNYTEGTERLVEDHLGDRPSETYVSLIREAQEKMRGVESGNGNAGSRK